MPKRTSPPRKKIAPPPLTSFDEIQRLCAKPIIVTCIFGEQPIRLECRRLTPHEQELLKLQYDELVPPIIPGKTEAEDRIQYMDPGFLAKKTRLDSAIRAQSVFWATKALQESETGKSLTPTMYQPETRPKIVEFVQKSWTSEILDQLHVAITAQALVPGEIVGFTSPGGQQTVGS